ncbi:MAG TPA: glycosyltransferase family 2 protein [Gemmatimonadales bacterium]|nr:glycosyltransferase family 2 protein [Gemmatimonadales bacterium]
MTRSPSEPAGARALGLVSVVLPAHDESASLPGLVAAIESVLGGQAHEFVIVDDGSGDRTWAVIQELAARHPSVRGVRFSRNFGHQAALFAGLREARGRAVIMLDADGQHPPDLLPAMLSAWAGGAEVVQAVRESNAYTTSIRRLSSHAYYAVLRALTGLPIVPGAADFRLLSRRAADLVLGQEGPPPFFRALLPWMGLRTVFLPYHASARLGGRSSYGWRRMMGLSLEGMVGYSAIPLRLAGLAGLFLAAAAFAYLAFVLVARLGGTRVVPGWASVAGLVALLSGIQLVVLATIGEYLARVFIATLHRPPYVIAERAGD